VIKAGKARKQRIWERLNQRDRGREASVVNRLAAFTGIMLMAVSVNLIYEPAELVTGGVTGIGIIIRRLTGNVWQGGVPLWITTLICNIPLFLTAYIRYGGAFLRRELLDTLLFTLALAVIPVRAWITDNLLLNAVFGGVIMGAGMGLTFAAGTTTGGVDLFAVLVHRRNKMLSEAQLAAAFDGLIVTACILVFDLEHALYALISIYIVMRVSDSILNGLQFSKMAYIISDRAESIAASLMHDMERGVTGIETVGMHTGKHRYMLLCVVSRKQMIRLKETAFRIDPKAFVIVADAADTLGEGFHSLEDTSRI